MPRGSGGLFYLGGLAWLVKIPEPKTSDFRDKDLFRGELAAKKEALESREACEIRDIDIERLSGSVFWR